MINIIRYLSNSKITLGIIKVDGLNIPLYSCELPWKNNKRRISCIPVGKYIVKSYISPSKGKCLIIEGVVGRKYILFHPGNKPIDSNGCVLPGLSTGYLNGDLSVLQSRDAMAILIDNVKKPTQLVIKNLYV